MDRLGKSARLWTLLPAVKKSKGAYIHPGIGDSDRGAESEVVAPTFHLFLKLFFDFLRLDLS